LSDTGLLAGAEQGVPGVDQPSDESELGTLLLALTDRAQEWVHRRVESVEFRDDRTVLRSVSVDFTLPDWAPSVTLAKNHVVRLVPLAHLKKRPLVGLDVFDEAGQSIPLLTGTQTGRMVAEGLVAFARKLVHGGLTGTLQPSLEQDLRAITGDNLEEARKAWHSILHCGDDDERLKLASNRGFRMLTGRYQRNFLMLIPLQDEERARRVLKFRYVEPFRRTGGPWRLLVGEPHLARFEAPGVQEGGGYHLEIDLPDGVRVTSVSLGTGDQRTQAEDDDRPSTDRQVVGSKVHLCVRYFPYDARAEAQTGLRATRSGWLASACFSVWLIAIILAVGDVWLRSHAKAQYPNISSTGVTLLLVIPGIFASLLARHAEHAMVAHLLRAIRSLLVTCSLLIYVAAGTLLMARTEAQLRRSWAVYATLATLIAVIVTVGLLTPPLRRRLVRLLIVVGSLLLSGASGLYLLVPHMSLLIRLLALCLVSLALVSLILAVTLDVRDRQATERGG
jgi:hypothetical protein